MSNTRKAEVFTAGCVCCDEAIALVKRLACSSCEVSVLDIRDGSIAKRAGEFGIRRVNAVVIDGQIADCCAGGFNEQALRAAGLGELGLLGEAIRIR
jgi:hypothetical protein